MQRGAGMRQYILKRILVLIPLSLGITFLVFVAMNFIPGDPVRIFLGIEGTEELAQQLRQQMGLDQPLLVRYMHWLGQLLQGDMGISLLTRAPVRAELGGRFLVTMQLAMMGVLFSCILALPLGIASAVQQNSWKDFCIRLVAMVGVSLPNFAVGVLLILFFANVWNWHPPIGFVHIWHDPIRALQILILPVIALGTSMAGSVSRMTRSAMLEVLRQDYIRTARSKGLSERIVIYRHALRNALIPILTLIGLQLGYLLGGAVIVEQIFSLPGLGRLLLTGIHNRDYPVVLGCVLVIAIVFALINAFVDILYTFVDPRIKYQ